MFKECAAFCEEYLHHMKNNIKFDVLKVSSETTTTRQLIIQIIEKMSRAFTIIHACEKILDPQEKTAILQTMRIEIHKFKKHIIHEHPNCFKVSKSFLSLWQIILNEEKPDIGPLIDDLTRLRFYCPKTFNDLCGSLVLFDSIGIPLPIDTLKAYAPKDPNMIMVCVLKLLYVCDYEKCMEFLDILRVYDPISAFNLVAFICLICESTEISTSVLHLLKRKVTEIGFYEEFFNLYIDCILQNHTSLDNAIQLITMAEKCESHWLEFNSVAKFYAYQEKSKVFYLACKKKGFSIKQYAKEIVCVGLIQLLQTNHPQYVCMEPYQDFSLPFVDIDIVYLVHEHLITNTTIASCNTFLISFGLVNIPSEKNDKSKTVIEQRWMFYKREYKLKICDTALTFLNNIGKSQENEKRYTISQIKAFMRRIKSNYSIAV